MNYVTARTVTDKLGADWSASGDANLAVQLANAWLAERLPLFDDVPDAILTAGAQIAKETIAGNMFAGRSEGLIASKSVKAGSVSSSKTFKDGDDGAAISAGEQIALTLIAPYIVKSVIPFSVPLTRS